MEALEPSSYGELQQQCVGDVLHSRPEREARSTDFGGMYHVTPAVVLRPACVADIQAALRFAAVRELTVSIRGMGHSQSGQGLGAGLMLDMTSLSAIVALDQSTRSIEVEAGISWRAVVDATFARGLLPVALTYALDTTVGGTLSVGGIGSAAWSHGPQVDNVLYLDVVTADGDLVRCSLEHERELFDAVRAGLGQCGVIVRAGLRLRPCAVQIETRAFVYRDLDELLRDAEQLAAVLDPQRLLAVRLGPDPLGQIGVMAVLFVGQDFPSDTSSGAEKWPTLHHGFEPPARRDPTWTPDGIPGHSFFRVYGTPHLAPSTSMQKHPWVDLLYPLSAGPNALATLVANPNRLLHQGSAELIFVRRGANPAPLLVTPASQLSMGLGMFATFSADDAERAGTVMRGYAREMIACGGKRYLSGYFDPNSMDWANHYGDAWSSFCAAKSRYDPARRFESPLVRWP